MHIDVPIDPDATVNATIACHPSAIGVLDRLGIDTCCGGGDTLRAAARTHSIDIEALTTALREAMVTR
jgi:regulator of cell morphogenesis and NO signaling